MPSHTFAGADVALTEAVFDPRQGYDRVASDFGHWHWFHFWRRNEAPIVRNWLRGLPPGRGLDAGAGIGTYIPDILGAGHDCVAVDLSWRMLAARV